MIKNLSRPNEPIAEGDLAEKQQGSMTVRWTQGALPTAADEARSWRDSELGRSDGMFLFLITRSVTHT